MADSSQSNSGGGCFSKLLFLILLVAAGGLGAAIFAAIEPQDLSDLSTPAPTAKAAPVREMKVVLKNSIDRGYPLTLQEAEINQWLARTLTTKQGGFLEGKVTLDRVWVRLEEGRIEVIMGRHFLGKPFTVSMFLQVERLEGPQGTYTEIHLHGGPYHPDFPKPPRGGRFGNLVVPQGFLLLVMPAFEKLAAVFPEEIELGLREMSRITLEKGHIVLDPREPLGQQGMPPTF
ncbi:MAG: hypothetical protein RLZZ214_161 [Verrucomicrobiota bacterium]|jgi:hypothetical protein